MKTSAIPMVALLGIAATMCPATAGAQDAERWQFTGSLNLFLPTVSGNTSFPSSSAGGSASVDIDKLLESLQFASRARSMHARGRGARSRMSSTSISATARPARARLALGGIELPAGVMANTHYDLSGWSWTLGAEWRAVTKPD